MAGPRFPGEKVRPEGPPVQVAETGGRVWVRHNLSGEVVTLESGEADERIALGTHTPISLDEAQRRRSRELLEDSISPVEAIGYGAARGLSGRLIDLPVAETEAGREWIGALEEKYPWLAGGAELGGTILPFSRAGGALRMLTFPGMADAAGQVATRGLRAGAPGLARTALSRSVGMGLESAAYGGAHEASAAAIEDTPLTWQRFMSGLTSSAALGAGLGLPFGALEAGAIGVGRLANKLRAAKKGVEGGVGPDDLKLLAEKQFGHAAPDLMDEAQAAMHASGGGEAVDPKFIRAMKDDPGLREKVLFKDAERLNELKNGALGEIDAVHEADKALVRQWQGKFKLDNAKALVDPNAADQSWAVMQAWLKDVDGELAQMQLQSKGVIGKRPKDLQELRDLVQQFRRDFDPAGQPGGPLEQLAKEQQLGIVPGRAGRVTENAAGLAPKTPEERFAGMSAEEKLKRLKRGDAENYGLDRNARQFMAADYLKKRIGRMAEGDKHLGSASNVARYMRKKYDDVREMLEDPVLWGEKAATMQREVNELLHARIYSDGHFADEFLAKAGKIDPGNEWVELQQADGAKIAKHFGELLNPQKSNSYLAARDHVAGSRKLADLMEKHFALGPTEQAALARVRASADSFEKLMGEGEAIALRQNQWKALSRDGVLGKGIWAPIIGSAAGGFIGGPIGGLAGFLGGQAFMSFINPAGTLAAKAVFERIMGAGNMRISEGVKTFFGRVGKTAKSAAKAARVSAVAGLNIVEKGESRPDAYHRLIAELSVQPDPDFIAQDLAESIGPEAAQYPGLAAGLAAQALRAREYVMSKAPVVPSMDTLFGGMMEPSELEMDEFFNIVRASNDPASIVEDLAAGLLSVEAVDAAEVSAPEMIAEVRSEILQIASDPEMAKKYTYDQKVQLSILFRVPADPTLKPEYISLQQASWKNKSAKWSFAKGGSGVERRTFKETGLNKGFSGDMLSPADRRERGEAPR